MNTMTFWIGTLAIVIVIAACGGAAVQILRLNGARQEVGRELREDQFRYPERYPATPVRIASLMPQVVMVIGFGVVMTTVIIVVLVKSS